MRGKLINDYQNYTNIQNTDLLLTQKDSDNTYRKVQANNVVPLASVMGAKFDYETVGEGGIWWEELGRHTLTGNSDTLEVADFAERLFLKIIIYVYNTGSTTGLLRFNNDANANYSYRYSDNGAADSTATGQTEINLIGLTSRRPRSELFVLNHASSEKICIGRRFDSGTAGAGNTGFRQENTYKWANSISQITTVTYYDNDVNTFSAGSTLIVLGHN